MILVSTAVVAVGVTTTTTPAMTLTLKLGDLKAKEAAMTEEETVMVEEEEDMVVVDNKVVTTTTVAAMVVNNNKAATMEEEDMAGSNKVGTEVVVVAAAAATEGNKVMAMAEEGMVNNKVVLEETKDGTKAVEDTISKRVAGMVDNVTKEGIMGEAVEVAEVLAMAMARGAVTPAVVVVEAIHLPVTASAALRSMQATADLTNRTCSPRLCHS